MEKVILVNEEDKEIGTISKKEAHKQGLLHRAVSAFVFDTKGRLLLQQRAIDKYHSNGLWSNTACTHPRPNESNIDAINRRLKEEMGIDANLTKKNDFIYKALLDNDLIEHEFDHVFFGVSDQVPEINTSEVSDFKYISYLDLITDIELFPHKYTSWFKIILKDAENEVYKYTLQFE